MIKSLRYNLRCLILVLTAIGFFCGSGCINTPESLTSGNKSVYNTRIISLVPSLTESIYNLEAKDHLVGCSNYCEQAKHDNIAIAGSVIKPNIEKIVSLRPDLLLVSDLVSENDIETLKKLGIRVEIFTSPKSFDEICSDFIRLGKLVDRKDNAGRIIAESKARIKVIFDKIPKLNTKPGIFIQIGASPIYAVIPGTFMEDYITFCGGSNIAKELTSGEVGREFVVDKNPDYIFIVTMGVAGEEEKKQWSYFKHMKAVAQRHVYIIDSEIACQPTPMTFIETLEQMNRLMAK